MLIGVPKEIKDQEYRVGLTPPSVQEFLTHGHRVLVETQAGAGIGASDADYQAAGAEIVANAAAVFAKAEMLVKVKEPNRPSARCCVRARSCSPIFTSRRIRSKPAT